MKIKLDKGLKGMTQIKLSEIRDRVTSMLEIEISEAMTAIKAAKKVGEDNLVFSLEYYIRGLNRARNIMDIILKDVK